MLVLMAYMSAQINLKNYLNINLKDNYNFFI